MRTSAVQGPQLPVSVTGLNHASQKHPLPSSAAQCTRHSQDSDPLGPLGPRPTCCAPGVRVGGEGPLGGFHVACSVATSIPMAQRTCCPTLMTCLLPQSLDKPSLLEADCQPELQGDPGTCSPLCHPCLSPAPEVSPSSHSFVVWNSWSQKCSFRSSSGRPSLVHPRATCAPKTGCKISTAWRIGDSIHSCLFNLSVLSAIYPSVRPSILINNLSESIPSTQEMLYRSHSVPLRCSDPLGETRTKDT